MFLSFQRLLCYGNAVSKYLLDHHQAKLLAALNILVLYAAVSNRGVALFANSFMGDKVTTTITIESDYANDVLIVSRMWYNSGSHILKRGLAEANVILVLALILYMGIASLLRTSWRVTRTFETRRSIIDVATIT